MAASSSHVAGAGLGKKAVVGVSTFLGGLSFRARTAVAMALVAIVTIALLMSVLWASWINQFQSYTRSTMDELASAAASQLARFYDMYGYWSTANLEYAASNASALDGLGIQIFDANGTPLYDSTVVVANQGLDLEADLSLAPGDTSETLVTPVVASSGEEVGTVRVWVYGSDLLLTQRDVQFRNKTFEAMGVVSILAIVFSIVMGLLASRWLTRGVRRITTAATLIKEGDLTARSGIVGSDDVGELGVVFDEMATSLEHDRELEHRLTSDVAHELRTPLMSILATVEAMQDDVLPCDQEHLALVASETKRLSRLVDSMLRLSRLENGSVRMSMRRYDLVEFASNIALQHRALAEGVGLDLRFENRTGVDDLEVEFDRDTMTQAVTNIVSNAMRYTEAPGSITVAVGRQGSMAEVSVTDTGMGIAKKDIERVFGRFWRAEESRNRVAGGLGVGLALTKEIIDRHHGHIEVESEVGVGTTFTLVVPLRQPSLPASSS